MSPANAPTSGSGLVLVCQFPAQVKSLKRRTNERWSGMSGITVGISDAINFVVIMELRSGLRVADPNRVRFWTSLTPDDSRTYGAAVRNHQVFTVFASTSSRRRLVLAWATAVLRGR